MSQVVLGIDVSKDKLDVALLRGEDKHFYQVANTPQGYSRLVTWLQKAGVGEMHACLEATGHYGEGIAYYLFEQGYQSRPTRKMLCSSPLSASESTRLPGHP